MSDKYYSWAVRGCERGQGPSLLLVLIPEGDDPVDAEREARKSAKGFEKAGGTNITVERVESRRS